METIVDTKRTTAEVEAEMDAVIEARKADSNHQLKMQFWITAFSIVGIVLGNLLSHASIKKYDEHF